MNCYGIYFEIDNMVYRLPVNPEEITTKKTMSIQKTEVLGVGQIAIASHEELMNWSFEVELPGKKFSYIETKNEFHNSRYYEKLFQETMQKKKPIRFVVETDYAKEINSRVLIESLSFTEKAGEEGDKYMEISLQEYKDYTYKEENLFDGIIGGINKISLQKMEQILRNPKSKATYTVQKGDTLWSIAKKTYGEGRKYTKILNANQDKIKNPNLIYVGQELKLP